MLYKVWDISAAFPVETHESLHDVRGSLWKERSWARASAGGRGWPDSLMLHLSDVGYGTLNCKWMSQGSFFFFPFLIFYFDVMYILLGSRCWVQAI